MNERLEDFDKLARLCGWFADGSSFDIPHPTIPNATTLGALIPPIPPAGAHLSRHLKFVGWLAEQIGYDKHFTCGCEASSAVVVFGEPPAGQGPPSLHMGVALGGDLTWAAVKAAIAAKEATK